jgi:hypothetical protein
MAVEVVRDGFCGRMLLHARVLVVLFYTLFTNDVAEEYTGQEFLSRPFWLDMKEMKWLHQFVIRCYFCSRMCCDNN